MLPRYLKLLNTNTSWLLFEKKSFSYIVKENAPKMVVQSPILTGSSISVCTATKLQLQLQIKGKGYQYIKL